MMSNYIVGNGLISQILGAYKAALGDFSYSISDKQAEEIGQILLNQNYKCVNYYHNKNYSGIFELDMDSIHSPCDPLRALKFCDCLLNQSYRQPEWKELTAKDHWIIIYTTIVSKLLDYK